MLYRWRVSATREDARTGLPVEPPRRARRLFVGRPMQTHQAEDELLPIGLALPIFAADAISSVAYATEAAMVVLLTAGLSALHIALPISIAVALLMAIVIASYRQTVRAYETSGGAYVVARENLGTLPSLVAAAALLVDYVLTVAVSVASGVLAITSAAPSLNHYNTELSLLAIVLITVVNLRGIRESGLTFALPTYGFIVAMLVAVGAGVTKCAVSTCPRAVAPHAIPPGVAAVTLFLVLKAFASGASALTGVESIANGVNAFRHPQSKNAAKTLGVLGVVAITIFVGVSYLAVATHARPSTTASVVSQIVRAVFPAGSALGWFFWVVQIFTFAVLILAANTSFQGFPRLSALLAQDRFIARQFTNLGDRLVFSNGVVVLAAAAAFLIWIYHANVNNLIHLYVVGVFTAFTLSQAGMVRYWLRTHGAGWQWRAVINGVGALATCRRDGRRGRDEVPGGRVDGDRRDPGDDLRFLRRAPALRSHGAPARRRGRSRRRGAAGTQRHDSRRRSTRRRDRPRALVLARDLGRRLPRRPRSPFEYRFGDSAALVQARRRRAAARDPRQRASGSARRCSTRFGVFRAASPTSSRLSCRSTSSRRRCGRRCATRASSC